MTERRKVRVVAALIAHASTPTKFLVQQRLPGKSRALLWEFPGGKVETGESDQAALTRELRERLDAEGHIGKKLGEKVHEYDGYRVALVLYEATLTEGRPLVAKRVKDFRWVASSEFDQYPFPDADQQTMDQLLGFAR